MYEDQTFESILERLLSYVDDKYDKREGSIIYDAQAPTAMELAIFYMSLGLAMNESFADTASYYYLAKRAAERGIYPKSETNACLKMTVTPADAAISIGDRFNAGELNYTVIGSAEGNESGAWQVKCETAGTIGNQQLGSLLPLETLNPLNDLQQVELTEVLIPGEDEEDTESLRERYYGSFGSEAFGGNQMDYKDKVNSLDGVGGCRIIREWENGYNPAKFIPSAAVDTWYQSVVGSLSDEVRQWLSAVYNAASQKLLTVGGTVKVLIIDSEFHKPSGVLIQAVQEALDPEQNAGEGLGLVPIGHVVNVAGVNEKTIDIAASYLFRTGSSFASLYDSICNAVDSYFMELSQSWEDEIDLTVRISQLETRILAIDGILDISDMSLNGIEQNLTLGADEIPVRGDVTDHG